MRARQLLDAVLDNEKSGGIILMICAAGSLMVVNLLPGEGFRHFWHTLVFTKPLEFWINDGLMTIFFLQMGLEIKREIYIGELKTLKRSMLPILAAMGGMLIPALIHFLFNNGEVSRNGYGIPMATDIAFSLGVLSLLGRCVPPSLKVFLTALAIIDDLGAILVIALFYSSALSLTYLGLALMLLVTMVVLNRMNIMAVGVYLSLGVVMWFCMLHSGIHATISGVLLAFAIPFRAHGHSPSATLQRRLHLPVTWLVLPLFALANTAISLPATLTDSLTSKNSVGIILGLVAGKPIGIFLFSAAGVGLGACALPAGMRLAHVLGVGMLAGIGFTMSIFITLLAFSDVALIDSSKIAILAGSLISGVGGYGVLRGLLSKGK